MEKPKNNTNTFIIILTLMVLGVIIVAGFTFFLPKPEKKNIQLLVINESYNRENISCRIKINDSLVFVNQNIKSHKDSLSLKKGRHIIEVSSIEGDYKTADTLDIKVDKTIYITISYRYIPPYNESLSICKENFVEQLMTRKNYPEEYRGQVIAYADTIIDEQYLKENFIIPVQRSFDIEIRDFEYIML